MCTSEKFCEKIPGEVEDLVKSAASQLCSCWYDTANYPHIIPSAYVDLLKRGKIKIICDHAVVVKAVCDLFDLR